MSEHGVDARFVKLSRERFEEKVDEVARRLRQMADEVERDGKGSRNRVNAPEFGWKASQVLHRVAWGVANLNLDGLVLSASEADDIAPDSEVQGNAS